AFDALDLEFLQTIADQAGVAISNARTYAQSEQQAAMLRALLSTTQQLNSTLDLRRLLQVIAEQARTLIEVDRCIIFLLNRATGILTPVVALDPYADQVLGMTVRLGEGITGHVAQSGVGELVNHAERDPRALTVPGTTRDPESLLASPLLFEGRVIGVMTLSRMGEREFSPTDLELLNSFASQAAVAVENARLYTESWQRARELERAHSRLEKAQNQLLQAEKLSAIGQLAAGMAHELNNPLTAIMGFAQLLESENLSPTGRSDLRRILASVERAQGIVSNLLTFAQQRRMSLQRVNLDALVERIVRMHSRELGESGVTVQQEVESLPPVYADPFQIEQLVLHLLRNAYRAISQGEGGGVSVRLGQPKSDLVRLEVSDDGPGIPADVLPHIFDPFFSTREVGQGQGLGLAICFGIVRAHKGRIWAEHGVPRGTRLIVELPLHVETAPDSEVPADRAILIVTADDELGEALLSIVEEMGHRASLVESGEAALAEVVVRRYDLVICDTTLPGMGVERLRDSVAANDPALAAHFVPARQATPSLAALPTIAVPLVPSQVRQVVEASLGSTQAPDSGGLPAVA
ncbi:MAG: GAF domain-containing protein, partial [Anaerolineae bacterium]|nr:GAF domain-containing protein [Anaerolineae bacterium]